VGAGERRTWGEGHWIKRHRLRQGRAVAGVLRVGHARVLLPVGRVLLLLLVMRRVLLLLLRMLMLAMRVLPMWLLVVLLLLVPLPCIAALLLVLAMACHSWRAPLLGSVARVPIRRLILLAVGRLLLLLRVGAWRPTCIVAVSRWRPRVRAAGCRSCIVCRGAGVLCRCCCNPGWRRLLGPWLLRHRLLWHGDCCCRRPGSRCCSSDRLCRNRCRRWQRRLW
jgi:hypothetical protein